ncbi:MAG TPA: hypothetical protein DCM28_14610 [Phycisphaerales bacterium]|nr:hypothetical protein [Phycisphaerales bacterium]HCD30837.1 hypothetical protein [Phycisphaerales bacterium]|tara:strand:+ start:470 stop:1150 length:681 start_codon:yes stop_codon:yes gene_type:complete
MQRFAASLVMCLLFTAITQAQGLVEEFESPADLALRWEVTRPLDANAHVSDGKLLITHDYDMRFRPGVSIKSLKPITITGQRIVMLVKVGSYDHGTAKKKNLFNAYKFRLGDDVAQLSVNRSVSKDVLRFFIHGKKVWDSYPYDRDRLFAPDTYIGFVIDGNNWTVIATDDPQKLTAMKPAGHANASQGKLEKAPSIKGDHIMHILAANVYGRQAFWSIDRILIQP